MPDTTTASAAAAAPTTRRRTRAAASVSAEGSQAIVSEAAPPAKQAKMTAPTLKVNEEELKCVVCLEFPSGNIVQCDNGHLLCVDCYERVVEAYQCVCPTCRVKLSRDRPSRNRFAEGVLAMVIVPCSHSGCTERVAFGDLKGHETEMCPFRPVVCKFAPVGCDSKLKAHELKAHQRECAMRQKSVKTILKRVLEREVTQKEEERRNRTKMHAQIKIAEMLSSRCRDISIREVVIERDELCDIVGSKPFKAFGATLAWDLFIEKSKDAPTAAGSGCGASTANSSAVAVSDDAPQATAAGAGLVGLVLSQRSRHPKRLRMSVFIMKGPDSELAFSPEIQAVHFTRNKRQSDVFPLPMTPQKAKELFEMGSLTIRVGLVDRRRGVSRSFSSDGAGGIGAGEDDDDDLSSSSEEDDDGLESDNGDHRLYYSDSGEDDDSDDDGSHIHCMEHDDYTDIEEEPSF